MLDVPQMKGRLGLYGFPASLCQTLPCDTLSAQIGVNKLMQMIDTLLAPLKSGILNLFVLNCTSPCKPNFSWISSTWTGHGLRGVGLTFRLQHRYVCSLFSVHNTLKPHKAKFNLKFKITFFVLLAKSRQLQLKPSRSVSAPRPRFPSISPDVRLETVRLRDLQSSR